MAPLFIVYLLGALYLSKSKEYYKLANTINFSVRITGTKVLQVKADGPHNITRIEGEENVLVDCPFSSTGAPIWRINDSLFDVASIQPPFIPTTFGITISLVTRNIDQTRFQCFAPTGNGLQVNASDVGTLTVSKQGKRII